MYLLALLIMSFAGSAFAHGERVYGDEAGFKEYVAKWIDNSNCCRRNGEYRTKLIYRVDVLYKWKIARNPTVHTLAQSKVNGYYYHYHRGTYGPDACIRQGFYFSNPACNDPCKIAVQYIGKCPIDDDEYEEGRDWQDCIRVKKHAEQSRHPFRNLEFTTRRSSGYIKLYVVLENCEGN